MSAGRTDPCVRVIAVFVCLLGCDRRPQDPPPPPSRHELVAAPPGALGAHAAGREAPPSLNSLVEPPSLEATPGTPQGQPEPPPEPEPEPEPAPDAGAPAAPRPSEGVAL